MRTTFVRIFFSFMYTQRMPKSYAKRINSILDEALFSYKYKRGLTELNKLNDTSGPAMIYAKGLLYDHLAMSEKNQSRRREWIQKAKKQYFSLLEVDRNSVKGLWGLGRIALHEKKYSDGIRFYKRAVNAHPESRSAKLSLATAYLWASKYPSARRIFLEDISAHGKSFRTLYQLALLERNAKRPRQASTYASQALELWKKQPAKFRQSIGGRLWEYSLTKIRTKK